MEIINVHIPTGVADLICKKTPLQAFEEMVKNNSLPLLELRTFGMVVTDIYDVETGETHHHVTYWENGQVSITSHSHQRASLIAVEEWGKESYPNGDEAMEIFYRHVSTT